MTHQLRYSYDEHDFLEIWLPESEQHPIMKREPGLYKIGSCAKNPESKRAFDSLMLDAFSKAYPYLLAEVVAKEPSVTEENYNVPELDLYKVPLSRILEEIHNRHIANVARITVAERAFS
jgi:hypothetical protein